MMIRPADKQREFRGAEALARRLCLPPLHATLIVGYGNDLRSDDGAGVLVAKKVAAQSPQARVLVAHQLTPDLADDIARVAHVIFVDAYAAPVSGAALRIERIAEDPAGDVPAFGHHIAPGTLVHLAKRLYGTQTEAWVLGVPAYCFVAGEKLSPETLNRIDEAVALIGGRAFSDN